MGEGVHFNHIFINDILTRAMGTGDICSASFVYCYKATQLSTVVLPHNTVSINSILTARGKFFILFQHVTEALTSIAMSHALILNTVAVQCVQTSFFLKEFSYSDYINCMKTSLLVYNTHIMTMLSLLVYNIHFLTILSLSTFLFVQNSYIRLHTYMYSHSDYSFALQSTLQCRRPFSLRIFLI